MTKKVCFRKEMNDGLEFVTEFVIGIPKFIIALIIAIIPLFICATILFLHIIEFNPSDVIISLILVIGMPITEFIWLIVIGFPFISCYIYPTKMG